MPLTARDKDDQREIVTINAGTYIFLQPVFRMSTIAIMATASQVLWSVMATMTALTTVMKITVAQQVCIIIVHQYSHSLF